jgi:hypothetical protein
VAPSPTPAQAEPAAEKAHSATNKVHAAARVDSAATAPTQLECGVGPLSS